MSSRRITGKKRRSIGGNSNPPFVAAKMRASSKNPRCETRASFECTTRAQIKPDAARNIQSFPREIQSFLIDRILCFQIPGLLYGNSLANAQHAYALCSNDPSLYAIFRAKVNSLLLEMDPFVNGKAIARLFGPHLRHVSLVDYVNSSKFLESAAVNCSCLKSLAVTNVNYAVLSKALDSLEKSGRSLRFLSICATVNLFKKWYHTQGIPKLRNLIELKMEGVQFNKSYDFFTFLAAPGKYLKKFTMINGCRTTGESLDLICDACPKLEHFDIKGVWDVQPMNFILFVETLQTTLRHLTILSAESGYHLGNEYFLDCPVDHRHAYRIASVCKNLRHLSLRAGILPSEQNPLSWIELCKSTLYSLVLVNYIFHEGDIAQMSNLLNLREVHFIGLGLDDFTYFCQTIGPHLKILNVESKHVASDRGLWAIGFCSNLEELSLGVPQEASRDHAEGFRLNSYSAACLFEQGLRRNLRKLSWRLPVIFTDISELERENPAEQLSGARLAYHLMSCKRLEFVHVCNMQPTKFSTLDFDAAFDRLRSSFPKAMVYVDEDPPTLPGRTWNGAEIKY